MRYLTLGTQGNHAPCCPGFQDVSLLGMLRYAIVLYKLNFTLDKRFNLTILWKISKTDPSKITAQKRDHMTSIITGKLFYCYSSPIKACCTLLLATSNVWIIVGPLWLQFYIQMLSSPKWSFNTMATWEHQGITMKAEVSEARQLSEEVI